jgi:hypothetical protein
MKTKSQRGTKEAIEQLNKWSKSEETVKLIVRLGPVTVHHGGRVSKFADKLFYFKPNGGGGMFSFNLFDSQTTIERTDASVCFSQGGVSMSLQELFRG